MHKKNTLLGIATAIVILTVCIGTVTAAYSNYDAIWTSSGNQFIQENTVTGIASGTTPTHYDSAFHFLLAHAPSGTITLTTPFVNTISKTGIHPKVRYLYFTLKMPTSVSVTYVYVYSGSTKVYSSPLTWAGTGAVKDYTLDMGAYHDMVRGINTAIYISNSETSINEVVETYGAGAKQEW